MKVHHNTTKRATSLNMTFVESGDQIKLVDNMTGHTFTGTDAKALVDQAVADRSKGYPEHSKSKSKSKARKAPARKARDEEDEGEEEAEEDETVADEDTDEGPEEGDSRSVVPHKYREIYKPNRDTNGDDMVAALHAYLHGDEDEGVDPKMFYRLCKDNGIDGHKWDHLKNRHGAWNTGMARMNLGNMLRAKLRRGEDVVIGGRTVKGNKVEPKVAKK